LIGFVYSQLLKHGVNTDIMYTIHKLHMYLYALKTDEMINESGGNSRRKIGRENLPKCRFIRHKANLI
jgi:hypothetical protein